MITPRAVREMQLSYKPDDVWPVGLTRPRGIPPRSNGPKFMAGRWIARPAAASRQAHAAISRETPSDTRAVGRP